MQVTISNLSGDTLKTLEFKGDPLQLCAAVCKDERPGSAKSKVSALEPDCHLHCLINEGDCWPLL